MNKEEQINEMVNIMFNWAQTNKMCWDYKHAESLAEQLYNAGYRKVGKEIVYTNSGNTGVSL